MPELMPAPAPTPAPVAASSSPDSGKSLQITESSRDESDFSDILNGQAGAPEATTATPSGAPAKAVAAAMGEDPPVADGKPLPELLTLLLAVPPQQEPVPLNREQPGATVAATAGEALEQRLAALLRRFDREAGPSGLRGRVGEIVSELAAEAGKGGDAVTIAVRQAVASLQQVLPRAGEFRPAAERLMVRMEQLLQTRASLQPTALAPADTPDVAASLPATAAPMTAPAAQAPQAAPAATATALPSTQVTVPFQQSGWDQAVGERVLWMVNRNLQGAEIRLNPPHLGPIEVRVQMHQDQAQVNFTAQHAVVREALEAALPRLRDMFQSQGVALVNVDVSDRSLAEQRERADAEGQAARGAVAGIDDELPEDEAASLAMIRTLPPDRAIDLFV